MTEQQKAEFASLTELFNHNKAMVDRQLSRQKINQLMSQYGADDTGHLCKIMALRGIRI